MRKTMTALALASACGLALCGAARADEIYTYDGLPTYASPVPVIPPLGLSITLNITDAAVRSGGFQLSGQGIEPSQGGSLPSFTGDVADFVSLSSSSLIGTATPTSFTGPQNFVLSLDFNPITGDVTSSSFASVSGAAGETSISGTGAVASGVIGLDAPQCNASIQSDRCTVSGSWTQTGDIGPAPIPEPASLAMLGAGLIGLAAAKRRTV